MVFLHGYLSNKEAWTAQIAYFSKFYRTTAIDFLGFGNSGTLPAAYSVGDYAKWLQDVLVALNVRKPHVMAHSFGCRVAVKAASENPLLFDKILLTGAAGIITDRGVRYKAKVGTYRLVKKIAPRFAERHFGSEEYRSLSPLMKESYKKIVNEDLRFCAEKVQNKVLLVQGTKDKTTPLKQAQIYLSHFPNATLKMLSGGHFAFVENPVIFNLTAEEFLYD